MGKVLTIDEVLNLSSDMPVECTRGRLTQLFKHTPTPHGTMQNGTLVDATGQIKVVFVDHDEKDKSMVGKTLTFLSHKGDHGWTGVKFKEKDNRGKKELVLWVTKTATITENANLQQPAAPPQGGNQPAQQPPQAPPQRQPANPPVAQPQPKDKDATDKAAAKTAHDALKRAEHHVARNQSIGNIATRAALKSKKELEEITGGTFEKITYEKYFLACFGSYQFGSSNAGCTLDIPIGVPLVAPKQPKPKAE